MLLGSGELFLHLSIGFLGHGKFPGNFFYLIFHFFEEGRMPTT